MKKLLVHSASQLVTVSSGRGKLGGSDMRCVDVLQAEKGRGLSLVVDAQGLIEGIDYDDVIARAYGNCQFQNTVDATGHCVIPGFVDAHTHPVWAGDRLHEFSMKLEGATYMEIHQAGGGIHYTVDHTRNASDDELFKGLCGRLRQMLQAGTTLVECKSGYGLEAETELKQLRVIDRARMELPVDISSTFLGAHAVPKGKSSEEATNDVLNVQLPRLKSLMDNGDLKVDNIDVFCEKGVFDLQQSGRILQAGKSIGLNLNFHGEEITQLKSAEMGADLGALAISHLEEISDDGISAMAQSGSVAVVLPTTAYILRLKPPPVRKMIDEGIAVALGSDFNPNAYCLSMPMVMHLACILFRMSMSESLAAATINAAAALGKEDTHGSLEVGKVGNMVILETDRWENIIYQFGCQEKLIKYVITHGNVVWQNF
ncbi:probable imidazolonepropionase [Liolophura sinensis]|uniref:probable imidazolonepropionase n=1 Tax=Liolophura sinensis TaxID=3198878 RepID=UPI0031593DB3